ncbi:hypothetical protein NA78x_005680 [Anatilimnocola sp. NA78]|uniref:hypothetical protein n=1 Tax=Anatilimnocola sp. NA78 TaxID=3415683 RepID=UPI003CE5B97D
MSNRSFLTSSNVDTIYPSFADGEYDAPNHTIATDVEFLPLFWLALFREGDLRQTKFEVQGTDVSAFAPLCTKAKALEQFDAAVPYLESILQQLGELKVYARLFRQAVAATPQKLISIELEEIANLYPPQHRFEEILRLALRGFDRPEGIHFECEDVEIEIDGLQIELEESEEVSDELKSLMDDHSGEPITVEGFTLNSHAEVLTRLTGLRLECPLPTAKMYLDDIEYTEDEQWNFTRVLGAGRHGSMGFGREVPWEKEEANFGWEVSGFDEDFEFEEEEDEEE